MGESGQEGGGQGPAIVQLAVGSWAAPPFGPHSSPIPEFLLGERFKEQSFLAIPVTVYCLGGPLGLVKVATGGGTQG